MDAEAMIEQGIDVPANMMKELTELRESVIKAIVFDDHATLYKLAEDEFPYVREHLGELMAELPRFLADPRTPKDRADYMRELSLCVSVMRTLYFGYLDAHMAAIGQTLPAEFVRTRHGHIDEVSKLIYTLHDFENIDQTIEEVEARKLLNLRIIAICKKNLDETVDAVVGYISRKERIPIAPTDPAIIGDALYYINYCSKDIMDFVLPVMQKHDPEL
jgi:hypothetical protein